MLLSVLFALVDDAVSRYLVDRVMLGSSFWSVGCLGGASMRVVGQRWRAR